MKKDNRYILRITFFLLLIFNHVFSQIIYTDVIPDHYEDSVGTPYYIDINHDTVNDFRLLIENTSMSCNCNGTLSSGNSFATTISTLGASSLFSDSAIFFTKFVVNLSYHEVIDSLSNWDTGVKAFERKGNCILDVCPVMGIGVYFSSVYQGRWQNVTDGYVGLRVTKAGRFHYGWARLDVDTVSYTLKDYAYNLIPDSPILAGDTGTGINTIDMINYSDNLIAYPNPTRNNLNLIFDAPQEMVINISLYDVGGRKLISEKSKVMPGTNRKQIDVSLLSPGIYLLEADNRIKRITIL